MEMPVLSPRAAALLSASTWAFNFVCQMYGMLSDPNMKDVADDYHSFLSPQPFAIGLFFFPQTCLQLYWIYRLFKNQGSPISTNFNENEGLNSGNQNASTMDADEELDEAVKYAPVFALGNLSIGLWMVFWNSEHLAIALIFVLINSSSQLIYVLTKLPALSKATALTVVVASMFAGIGVLDVFDNTATAFLNYKYNNFHPGIVSYVLTLISSIILPLIFDPIVGACLVYDFLGLVFGQLNQGWWTLVLVISSGLCAAVVAMKAAKERETYRAVFLDSTGVL